MRVNDTFSFDARSSRRQFLYAMASAAFCSGVPAFGASVQNKRAPFFRTRGVVLATPDLSTLDWPRRAAQAGLTTIATHVTPREVAAFLPSDQGQEFLAQCREHGIQVEHELHAMSDLLPRELFAKDPSMFRMDEKGERRADCNCCVHSANAIDLVCESAVKYANILRSTTGRYFYWMDDGQPMCKCPRCRAYSDSEQALILENAMAKALRKVDARATLAHLAYAGTMEPPVQVKPATGIFLEFGPIGRTWDEPITRREAKGGQHGRYLDWLDANLAVFGRTDAQVLEYWLDVSLFSSWKRDAKKKLPWRKEIFLQDIAAYAERGIRHITSFAVYIDADYVKRYGPPPLEEYGEGLNRAFPSAMKG